MEVHFLAHVEEAPNHQYLEGLALGMLPVAELQVLAVGAEVLSLGALAVEGAGG